MSCHSPITIQTLSSIFLTGFWFKGLRYVLNLTKAAFIYSNESTKLVYPQISKQFSETTIYQGYIHFCKINKLQPIPSNLQRFCLDNTSEFKLSDSQSA